MSRLLCLAGATATGKTALAHALAERLGARLLSADAMLVYRGMDVGTAKPTPDERARFAYRGLDCVDPDRDFSAGAWLDEARAAQAEADAAGVPLLAVGGTGLYFAALLRGLDPAPPADPALRARLEALPPEALRARLEAHGARVADARNPRRLVRALEILESGRPLPTRWAASERPRLVALTRPRPELHARIAARVDAMYAQGLPDEVRGLRRRFPRWSRTAAQAIGYAEALALLDGALTEAQARERTIVRTRQLARRQESFLRTQFDVAWIQAAEGEGVDALAGRVLAAWEALP